MFSWTSTKRFRNVFVAGTVLLTVLALSAAPEAKGQILYGTIIGNVTDASGGAAPGAEVTVTQQETNFTRTVSTNEAGVYSVTAVPSGTYEVQITLAGFKAFVSSGVPVTVNNTSRINAVLEVGAVTESVTVTSEATLLQTDKSDIRLELENKELTNLPVGLNRNYQSLFKTLPGFTPPVRAHSIQTNPSRSLRFNVNGVSGSINNTKLDGASATNPQLPHITSYVPSLDSIETVNIVTNSFDAEQGLAGGAAISVKSKGGTNEVHGSGYWFHDDSSARARPYFFPEEDGAKPRSVFNQYGGSIGGPIMKDKLFYFAGFEFTTTRRIGFRTNEDVPSLAVRGGDFSELLADGEQLYDPATGNLDGTGRTAIAGNFIDPARIDPVAQLMIPLIPLPNKSGVAADSNNNNYLAAGLFVWDRGTLDTRMDYIASDNLNLFGTFNVLDYDVIQPSIFGHGDGGNGTLIGRSNSPFGGGGGNTGTGRGNTYKFTIGANYMVSPTFIVDGNFGYIKFITDSRDPGFGNNIGLDFLGIPGTNGDLGVTEGYPYQGGWPMFDLSGFSDYGTQESFMPYLRKDPVFNYTSNFTWVKDAHEIKWGFDISSQHMNQIQPEISGGFGAGSRGRFNFRRGPVQLRDPVTGDLSAMDSRLGSFAAFMLGAPERVGKNLLTEAPFATRNNLFSLYVRDRWQITPKFTLSYGTRYEYFPIPTRGDRGFERYDPVNNVMLIGGVGSVPMDMGVEVSKTLFAPRVGFAYRANEAVVIRAGYGLTNDPYTLSRPLRTNHPLLIELDNNRPNSGMVALNWDPTLNMQQNGIPAIIAPGLGDGIVPIDGNITAITMADKFDRGYIQSWNLVVQSKLAAGFVGEIGYVASRQIRQAGVRHLNYTDIPFESGNPLAVEAAGSGNSGRVLNQAFGRSANTAQAMPIGGSHYDALQARLTRRFSGGHGVDVSYTWGKSISNSGEDNSDGTLDINIPRFNNLNRRVSGFNRPHNLQITHITELPFGNGKRWLNSGVGAAILGGWQVNGILSFYDGTPFNIDGPGDFTDAANTSERADQIGPIVYLGGTGPGQKWFDTSAFAEVCTVNLTNCKMLVSDGSIVPADQIAFNEANGIPMFDSRRIGTAGFNILERPGVANWDFSMFRSIAVSEKVTLQLRVEGFNFTNSPHFSGPDNDVDDDSFGEITGIDSQAGLERSFRFGLRLQW